jgi:hypothetical protein
MKTLALESAYVLASVLFWLFALPFALVAFPIVGVVYRATQECVEDLASLAKHLTVRRA